MMKLPKSFNDITVSQFQECYFLLKEKTDESDPFSELLKWSRVISCLSGVDINQITGMPVSELKKVITELAFLLNHEILKDNVKKYIVINRTIYRASLIVTDKTFSTAQGLDLRSFAKPIEGMSEQDTIIENLDKLLASVYLPFKRLRFKYNGEDHPKIANDFKSAKIGDVYGAVFFYSKTWERSTPYILQYGESQAIQKMEDALTMMENLESTGDGK